MHRGGWLGGGHKFLGRVYRGIVMALVVLYLLAAR